MAALSRPTKATYEIHEEVTVNTVDHEDHTFCGILFPVKCKEILPLDHLLIRSVAVRGGLGPLTVWVSNLDHHSPTITNHPNRSAATEHRIRLKPKYWTKVYEKTHAASFRNYKELVLDTPIKLLPGQVRAIYIHSTLPNDEAIVYDNSYYGSRQDKRYEDDKLAILTGRAHVSTEVFGQRPIWGAGNAWRDRREFVGRLEYGTVYKLWNPQYHFNYGSKFQKGACALFLCQRRWESPWSMLPDECIFYILNMCRWDWFDDNNMDMKAQRRKKLAKEKEQLLRLEQQREEAETQPTMEETVATIPMEQDETGTSRTAHPPNACACSRNKSKNQQDEDEDEDDEDQKMSHDEDDEEESAAGDEDDDDDDDEEWQDQVDNDEDNDGVDSSSEDDDDWSDNEFSYHANHRAFTIHVVDSDEDDDDDNDDDNEELLFDGINLRRHFIPFARLHFLRALASMEDRDVQF